MKFEVGKRCAQNKARHCTLTLAHGRAIQTPAFMPVGTQATVKTVSSQELTELGFGLILGNTYHLALRPGSELIHRLGGLHQFMSWPGAILTDSGGYQVMSLSGQRVIKDEGVTFRSHLDGSELFLSPERSIEIQAELGVDIAMALDVCAPYPCSREEARKAMDQTHRWAPRNLSARQEHHSVFGIVQGGIHMDFRTESAQFLGGLPFDGFAIGGVSVGEPSELQYPVVTHTTPLLPESKPRYLMGVGHPQDIIHGVAQGIDLFDCVLPTRMARHHCLYTLQGRINILAAKWAEHNGPVDPDSTFPVVSSYSAAYLRHLFKAKEPLGARLASLHNLAFYARLMEDIRLAIREDSWPQLVEKYRFA